MAKTTKRTTSRKSKPTNKPTGKPTGKRTNKLTSRKPKSVKRPRTSAKTAPSLGGSLCPPRSPAALTVDSILAWEDDPGAPTMGMPIERPIPVAPTHGLATA